MKRILLAALALLVVTPVAQSQSYDPVSTTICAEKGPNGYVLSGIISSAKSTWQTNDTIGSMIGDGNCEDGWSVQGHYDNRLMEELPNKFCPPIWNWVYTSPEGIEVPGAETEKRPCIERPKTTVKPLMAKGESAGSGGSEGSGSGEDSGEDSGDGSGDDNGSGGGSGNNNGGGDDNGSCNAGQGQGNGNGCNNNGNGGSSNGNGSNGNNGNSNNGGGSSCNAGGGNGSEGCDPGNSGNTGAGDND